MARGLRGRVNHRRLGGAPASEGPGVTGCEGLAVPALLSRDPPDVSI